MKTNLKKLAYAGIITATVLSACKKDEDSIDQPPPPANESEVITTLRLTFTDSAQVAPSYTAMYKDIDGDGGNPAVQFDSILLKSNTTYWVNVLVLDETKTPADTISNEILEEANDHQFFFNHQGININTTYLDRDSNNPPLPLGLSTKWKTGAVSKGTSQIVLKHQPRVKNGTQNTGSTDIELTFKSTVN